MTDGSRFRRSVAEHQAVVKHLLATIAVRTEALPLRAACGRALAADVTAPISLPPFDNSQMDGYAVRASDLAPAAGGDRVELAVVRPIAAGSAPAPLRPGTAAPIMTGAPLPDGADTIVPIEAAEPATFPPFVTDTTVEYDAAARVGLPAGTFRSEAATVTPGQFVRAAGSDVAAGHRVMSAGERITARHAGLAAALGMTHLEVIAQPRVLVIATGEEIVEPGTIAGAELAPGQIFESNSTLLAAALAEAGVQAEALRVSSDSPDVFMAELRDAVVRWEPDLIMTSGGISAGAYEVVKLALAAAGVVFGAAAMQPGGPQGAGLVHLAGRDIPLVAFPGNPVSSYVSFEMFVRPVLVSRFGAAPRRRVTARLTSSADSPAGKLQLRRARLTETTGVGPTDLATWPTVELLGGPGSHLMTPLAAANALVLVDESTSHLNAGDAVSTLVIGE